ALAPLHVGGIALVHPQKISRARGDAGLVLLPHIANSRKCRRLDYSWLFRLCGSRGSFEDSRPFQLWTFRVSRLFRFSGNARLLLFWHVAAPHCGNHAYGADERQKLDTERESDRAPLGNLFIGIGGEGNKHTNGPGRFRGGIVTMFRYGAKVAKLLFER